ncbi:serine protease [Halobacteriovorax sp.]|uniref:trypsin-like serine peptidase n=1 Tax=Halobacteriovorax sp. TaxID=2020862 RepID=UPI003567D3F6
MKYNSIYLTLMLISSLSYGSIHGPSDDRYKLDEITNKKIKELAKSTAFITKKNPGSSNSITLQTSSLMDLKGMCSNERFANSPSVYGCSGVLIDTNKVLTAGHCVISEIDCKDMVISFSYTDHSLIGEFKDNQIYKCKSLIAREKNYLTHLDYAVIELDRDVLDRLPVSYNKSNSLSKDDPLFMIGHPVGIPTVISTDAKVLDISDNKFIFPTDLDAMIGNSGSPVFNHNTYELEGILVRGGSDFDTDFDSDDLCRTWYRSRNYPQEKAETEDVLKINSIPYIKLLNNK